MMKSRDDSEDKLNKALEDVLKGKSPDLTSQDLAEFSEELKPLIKVAAEIKSTCSINASASLKLKVKNRLSLEAEKKKQRVFNFGMLRLFRWAVAPTIIVIVLLISFALVAGAQYAMPDSPFYSVKIWSENQRLAFTTTELGKAELHIVFSNRRVDELKHIASKANVKDIETLSANLTGHLMFVVNTTQKYAAVVPAAEKAPATISGPHAMLEMTPTPIPAPTPAPVQLSPEETTALKRLKSSISNSSDIALAEVKGAIATAPDSVKPAIAQLFQSAEQRCQQALVNLQGY